MKKILMTKISQEICNNQKHNKRDGKKKMISIILNLSKNI